MKSIIFGEVQGMTTIGERLAQLRSKIGLNQTDFASQFGIAQGTYKNYESGSVDPPLNLLVKICAKYDVNANELILGHSRPTQDELDKLAAAIFYTFNFLEERDLPVTAERINLVVATLLNFPDDEPQNFTAARPLLNTIFASSDA
jgi:transcriptional regulator with XRE-family HTH domain